MLRVYWIFTHTSIIYRCGPYGGLNQPPLNFHIRILFFCLAFIIITIILFLCLAYISFIYFSLDNVKLEPIFENMICITHPLLSIILLTKSRHIVVQTLYFYEAFQHDFFSIWQMRNLRIMPFPNMSYIYLRWISIHEKI